MLLESLNKQSVNQLIADTLHASTQDTVAIAELTHKKTQGNPFFVNELLKNLYETHQLFFLSDQGRWDCNLSSIQQMEVSDNVVEFMVQRIQQLDF